jgi:hypothetical protein
MKVGDIARLTYYNSEPLTDAGLATALGIITNTRWNEMRERKEYFIFYFHKKVSPNNGWWVPKHRLEVINEN